MSKIEVKIVGDSINSFGDRLTTMVCTYPRIIHSEFMTHRMFSRNSASSRAIPFDKMLKSVMENPFIPIAWQKDHKGMQGTEYITNKQNLEVIERDWLEARDNAIRMVERLNSGFIVGEDSVDKVTKQLCNRLLESFMWHTVIVTSSEWENFFALRCPRYQNTAYLGEKAPIFRSKKDYLEHYEEAGNVDTVSWLKLNKSQAEIHMMALAEAMWDAYNESSPKELKAGDWHIPFGDIENLELSKILSPAKYGYESASGFEEESKWVLEEGEEEYYKALTLLKVKIATARCARVSYTVVGEEGKEPNYDNDLKLHDRLLESGHWSPFEHIARAMTKDEYVAHIRNDGLLSHIDFLTDDVKVRYSYQIGLDDPSLGWSGNLKGFVQYRKTFYNENIK